MSRLASAFTRSTSRTVIKYPKHSPNQSDSVKLFGTGACWPCNTLQFQPITVRPTKEWNIDVGAQSSQFLFTEIGLRCFGFSDCNTRVVWQTKLGRVDISNRTMHYSTNVFLFWASSFTTTFIFAWLFILKIFGFDKFIVIVNGVQMLMSNERPTNRPPACVYVWVSVSVCVRVCVHVSVWVKNTH